MSDTGTLVDVFARGPPLSQADSTGPVGTAAHGRTEAMHGNETAMPSLKGARVLVVQNDPFVAVDVDLMIDEAEGEVVALAKSPKEPVWLLEHESIDTAAVDPNLGDHEAA